MVTSFHHQPEAQHPKSSAIHKYAGRLPHLCERSVGDEDDRAASQDYVRQHYPIGMHQDGLRAGLRKEMRREIVHL
jgi:hypothetical protein